MYRASRILFRNRPSSFSLVPSSSTHLTSKSSSLSILSASSSNSSKISPPPPPPQTVDPWDLHPPMEDTYTPSPIPRPVRNNEPLSTLKSRLLYQSRKRGILETDLLLSTFIDKNINTLSEAQLKEYDELLEENDWDLYYWFTEKKTIPDKWKESKIVKMLVSHAKNEGKKILRMPDIGKDVNK
ncbi:Flavinator of succinate dehydrogenase-domain-containing protein [Paraphysoderma sedebokerense]|nr:Flavinator of succinate dehydrogenase-domain-containing protein [Paraphysoderma sedebokerense]